MHKEWEEIILEITPPDEALYSFEEAERELRERDAATSTQEALAISGCTGVVIGVLAGLKASGEPLVVFSGNPAGHAVPARSVVAFSRRDIACKVALMFEAGDLRKPIVIGRIENPEGISPSNEGNIAAKEDHCADLVVDGERFTLTGKNEILLHCGKASILLRSDGKIVIKGTELLSRSSGLNKIKGAAVHIN